MYYYLADVLPNRRISLIATVVTDLSPKLHMKQRGALADSSGMLQFHTWANTKNKIEVGSTYNITNAVSREFNDEVTIDLTLAKIEPTIDIGIDIAKSNDAIPMRWRKLYGKDKNKTK